jgi:hypothetical protein
VDRARIVLVDRRRIFEEGPGDESWRANVFTVSQLQSRQVKSESVHRVLIKATQIEHHCDW